MMMALVRIQVGGGIVRVILPAGIVRTMDVAVAGDFAHVRPIAFMRGDRPGMKAGQDHRKEAEEGDK